jgi:hypothetical protein
VNPAFLSPGVRVTHSDGVNHQDGRVVLVYHQPPVFCGALIYADTTLHQNLDCRGKPGLTIGGFRNPGIAADTPSPIPVVLNLNGHTIIGDNSTTGVLVRRTAATIENGTMRGFGVAVASTALDGLTSEIPANATISHMVLSGGGTGVAADGLVTVEHSHITHMSQVALFLNAINGAPPPGGGVVTNNTITDSAAGIVLNEAGGNISGNVISHNTGPGISGSIWFEPTTIAGNTITDNRSGIAVTTSRFEECLPTGCAGTLAILDNVVKDNGGAGIVWLGAGGPGSQVAGNIANDNGATGDTTTSNDGIQLGLDGSVSSVTVTANQARGNIGDGIEATGVIDGGGNLASGNFGPAQCTGISCSG